MERLVSRSLGYPLWDRAVLLIRPFLAGLVYWKAAG